MNKKLLGILVCPSCKGKIKIKSSELWCKPCKLAYPIKDGIPVMLENEARVLTHDDLE
jgi:uncharacterized protein